MTISRPTALIIACLAAVPVLAQTTFEARTPHGMLGERPAPARLSIVPELETPFGQGVLFEGQEGSLVLSVNNSGGSTASNVVVKISRKASRSGFVLDTLRYVGLIAAGATTELRIPVSATVVRSSEIIPLFIEASDSSGFSVTHPFIVELEPGSGDNRQPSVLASEGPENLTELLSGRNWLLVIGINRYDFWPELQTPVHDARTVRDLLVRRYGFDRKYMVELFDQDGTRANIIKGFESLAELVRPEDNLLVYYGGHGRFDKTMNRGYWIPVNAEEKSTAEYLSNTELHALVSAIQSRATLVISDACFSGTLFRGPDDVSTERYFREVAKLKARQALISGGDEPVLDAGLSSDHSVFAHHLIRQLEVNQDKYLTANTLFERIKLPVSNSSRQTPQCRPIPDTGDEGGQFVFVRYR